MRAAELLSALERAFGDLGTWWPAESPFEIAVGAVLVQAVTWRQAAQAVKALAARDLLRPHTLAAARHDDVASAIRPALFHQQKASYLIRLAQFAAKDLQGDLRSLGRYGLAEQERMLLALPGAGRETAAAIMVYALGEAAAVVDAYAMRILPRVGAIASTARRPDAKAAMSDAIAGRPEGARLLHAGIVELGRLHCRPEPLCATCPLEAFCPKILGYPVDGRSDRPASDAGRAAAGREAGNARGGRLAAAQGGRREGSRPVGQGRRGGLGQPQRQGKRPGRGHRGA
jgi:endonuclease-3 related protein